MASQAAAVQAGVVAPGQPAAAAGAVTIAPAGAVAGVSPAAGPPAAAADAPVPVTSQASTGAEAAEAAGAAGGAAAVRSSTAASGVLTKSTESFKVLTECPLIVMLLFQLYPRYISSTIPNLIPLMVQTLALRPPQAAVHRTRLACTDFMAAQVKTLSFLTYLLRAFADFMRPYQESIPKCVIQLLLTCPPESVSIRKDILVATRHILATDFRVGFFNQIDVLLDEKFLIGSGHLGHASVRASHETLRPLACSTLADLVHHVRGELGITHLSKVVYIFSCNIHDATLPLHIQTTSVRLLLNLVENIFHKSEPEGRALLVRILHCLVSKFATLKQLIPKHLAQVEATKKAEEEDKAKKAAAAAANGGPAEAPIVPSSAVNTTPGAPKTPDAGDKSAADTTRECKQLLKTMILGVKTVVWSVSHSRAPVQPQHALPGNAVLQKGMSESECLLVARLLKSGLRCFMLYSSGPDSSAQEEKEVLDYFAGVFTVLEVRNFSHIFQMQMPFLYERVLANHVMSTILQHFLANSHMSRYFADILLGFLVSRIKELGSTDEPQSAVLLRLFKLVFGSITLFPENEPVLRPHLSTIVVSAMRCASHVPQPLYFFSLLRALFKSIGGGKFEQLYKEFLPLLPSLLHSLIRAHATAHQPAVRELLLELCLTLPARLSTLLPYLHLLMHPVLHALRSTAELVTLALRTLEFWIDHLHPEFVQPLMAPLMRELMIALCKQLKPAPHPFGPTALRILGKLGGRNRQFLHHREPLGYKGSANTALAVQLRPANQDAAGGAPIALPLDGAVTRALALLCLPPDDKGTPLQKEAYALVRTCVMWVVSPPGSAGGGGAADGAGAMEVEGAPPRMLTLEVAAASALGQPQPTKGEALLLEEESLLTDLVFGVFVAAADPALKAEAEPLLTHLMHHAALLVINMPQPLGRNSPPAAALRLHARPRCFLDALLRALASDARPQLADLALQMLKVLTETLEQLLAAADGGKARPPHELYDYLAREMSHHCYTAEMRCKSGPTRGLRTLVEAQPPSWLLSHELHIASALLHVSYDGAVAAQQSAALPSEAKAKQKAADDKAKAAEKAKAEVAAEPKPEPMDVDGGKAEDKDKDKGTDKDKDKDKDMDVDTDKDAEKEKEKEKEKAKAKEVALAKAKAAEPDAHALLIAMVRRCHGGAPLAGPAAEKQAGVAKQLIARAATELSGSNAGVRDAAKRLLLELSSLGGTTCVALLLPLRPTLLTPLLTRKLRSLPLLTQVAHLEAVSFCLKQQVAAGAEAGELLPLDEPLVHLLQEALAIADGDEPPRDRGRMLGLHMRGVSLEVRLRVVCIELLCAAMSTGGLKEPRHAELRNKIISGFFKCLTVRHEEVVEVSRDALAYVIAQQKLQKELLQSSLRPILLNLADYRKLSVPLLQGLGRLLALLSNFFNLTLGEKLLEHLRRWTDPEAVNKARRHPPLHPTAPHLPTHPPSPAPRTLLAQPYAAPCTHTP